MKKVTDEQIMAWIDGELSAEDQARIEALIATDPEIAAKAASFEASKLPYKSAMNQGIPPVPSELLDQVTQWSQISTGPSVGSTSSGKSFSYWSGVAATVLILVGATFGGVRYLQPSNPAQEWTDAIVSYQNFYVADTVSHIKSNRSAALAKLNELRQRYPALPATPPDLTAQGYAFKRLQRLDFDNKPVLQMVFYKPGKRPLAICLMPDGADFQSIFTEHELLNSYVWQSNDLRAIVVADEEQDVLKSISQLLEA
jgi:anti-sigma factor RsiW